MFKLNLSPHTSITISKNQTEKQLKNPSKCDTALGILSILREALKIGFRNGKVMVSIFLPVFLSYSLLTYCANLGLSALLKKFILKLTLIDQESSELDEYLRSEFIKDIRRYLVLQSVKWLFSSVIWLFCLVVTISLSSEAYTGKKVTAKDVFSRIGGRWRRSVITSIYMALISISLMVVFSIFIGLTYVVARGVFLVGLVAMAAILGAICYLYVAAVWMLSLVVSVLEDDLCGLKAIDKARELMKGKRARQGCVMKLLLALTSAVVYVTSSFLKIRNYESDDLTQEALAILIPQVFITCLLKFIMFMMFTVFYHECKMSHEQAGDEGEIALYAPIDFVEA